MYDAISLFCQNLTAVASKVRQHSDISRKLADFAHIPSLHAFCLCLPCLPLSPFVCPQKADLFRHDFHSQQFVCHLPPCISPSSFLRKQICSMICPSPNGLPLFPNCLRSCLLSNGIPLNHHFPVRIVASHHTFLSLLIIPNNTSHSSHPSTS